MNIKIKGKEYTFIHNYKENECLRQSFNQLTRETWEFDFELWFQSGYWDDSCHLYSLLDGSKVISHITVSVFNSVILGKEKTLVQLGTVMTDDAYREQGLNKFLMEKVLEDWTEKCDFIYLFANDTVLDFYPKFGFAAVEEYEAVKTVFGKKSQRNIRKMNVSEEKDLQLLDKVGRGAVPLFDLSVVNNIATIMFYCLATDIFKDNLYYVEDMDAIVIAEYEGADLIVHDILSTRNIDIDVVIDLLVNSDTENVRLRFIPKNKKAYQIRKYKEEDLTLFVSSDVKELFDTNQLIFPSLSHT